MTAPFALFRVAAGPRIGHGHLRRAEVLADALGRTSMVSIRGGGAPTSLPVVSPATAGATLDAVSPAVLVLDDPHQAHASAWCVAAQSRGIPVVSLHDLGIARVPSALAFDGSVTSPSNGWPAAVTRRGLEYAIIRTPQRRRIRVSEVARVLVSLGGGSRGRLSMRIAGELLRQHSHVEVLVAAPGSSAHLPAGVRRMSAPHGIAPILAQVQLAVLGGGVSLYEAAAAGVPAVALAAVEAQRPTIRGFVRRGTARDAGRAAGVPSLVARRVATAALQALADAAWLQRAAATGPRLVDGRGSRRVAREVLRLAGEGRRG